MNEYIWYSGRSPSALSPPTALMSSTSHLDSVLYQESDVLTRKYSSSLWRRRLMRADGCQNGKDERDDAGSVSGDRDCHGGHYR